MLKALTSQVTEPSNWKATASSIGTALLAGLTVLAGLSYELGPVASIIPPNWKPLILKISGGSTLALWLYGEWQKALIRNQIKKQLKLKQ